MTDSWEADLTKWIRAACVAEVSFTKPGNVSLTRHFDDAIALDFLRSADVAAPEIAQAAALGIGQSTLNAVLATRSTVGHNTNLGIVLLLTPLAAVPRQLSLMDGIEGVLSALSVNDAILAYRAIAAATPGGLGTSERQDVADTPTQNLRDCMRLAADRDLIAAQYANGFQEVLKSGLKMLSSTSQWPIEMHKWRIAWLATSLMANWGDSLIQRKCGFEMSHVVQNAACEVLSSGWPFTTGTRRQYGKFDEFLRADGHQRNPGTTADMIAAILFAAFREGTCSLDESTTQLIFTGN